jgi:hypothetical protein
MTESLPVIGDAFKIGESATNIAGGLNSLFGNTSAPNVSRKPFKGQITTPAFTFGGGVLGRTSPFVPQEENRLRGLIGDNRLGISALRERTAGTGRFVGDLAGLQEQVTPGFGRLTESLKQSNRDREAQERGNLRESLRERRVFGSSFANAAEQGLALDFAREEERLIAESFIAELDLSRQLIQDQAALELNLSAADAALLNQDLAAIQTEAALLNSQVNRELSELDIATEFLAVVNQKEVEAVADDMEEAAENFVPGSGTTTEQLPAAERGGGGAGAGVLAPFSGGIFGGVTRRTIGL